MNLERLPPAWYRLRFREYLQKKSEKKEPEGKPEDTFLVADTLSLKSLLEDEPLHAPQGFGEMIHPLVDENRGDTTETPDGTVEQIRPKSDSWASEDAYEYLSRTASILGATSRQQVEDAVRKLKWSNEPCVHCTQKGFCSRLNIRCGDRMQFATRESKRQQLLPHQCRYAPGSLGSHVLVVDPQDSFREFCRSSLLVFLGRSSTTVVGADTGDEALAILNQLKIQGKRCGLVIADIGLHGMSGYQLVNELYDRNFTTRVMLMKEHGVRPDPPSDFAGDKDIVPGKRLVHATLTKPLHSEKLIQSVREMGLA